MEALFFILIALAVIGPILGGLFWLIFYVWLAKTAPSAAERNLQQTLPTLEQLIQQAARQGPQALDAAQQAQIMSLFMQAQNRMGQLDDLHRQQYDVRMGELMGMAAEAGIDWRPS
jgi:hypothetical protein